MQLYKILALLVLLSASLTVRAGGVRCESLFDRAQEFKTIPLDLSQIYAVEKEFLSPADVSAENKRLLETLQAYTPQLPSRRWAMIPLTKATALLRAMQTHPVIGYTASAKYDRPDVGIGYCFGRATYAHLMLLKMGVQKESIMKIWAAGEMKGANHSWAFHVATITFTPEMGWVAIDTNHNTPITAEQWMTTYQKQSTDQKLRFYVTPAEKFSFEIGKYDRVQLGLDLQREQDWYQHYFVDLMRAVRETDPVSLKIIHSKNMASDSAIGAQLTKAFAYLKRAFGF